MLKKLGLAIFALTAISGLAFANGYWQDFPGLGTTANSVCTSYGNNGVCNQYKQAGPTYLTGNEQFPADTYSTNQGQQTITIPTSYFGAGYGLHTLNSTTGTGQNPVVADGVSEYIYTGAGTATFATLTFPPNPMRNQHFCIVNAGTGVLTLTSLVAGTNTAGVTPTFVGTTPTSIPVMTAVGTAGTVTLGRNCWAYSVANAIWYRVL